MKSDSKLKDTVEEYTKVIIENNNNSNISNNKIASRDTYLINVFQPFVEQNYTQESEKSIINLIDSPFIADDKFKRALKNITFMDKYLFLNKKSLSKPIIRTYGLFSNLSSNRDKATKHDDYNLMILEEKTLLEKFIEMGHEVRVVISLDIPYIINQWGYDNNKLLTRVLNLSENVDIFLDKFSNLKVAFDTHNRMESIFILGNTLLIKALAASPDKGYYLTKYDNNRVIINNSIKTFDDIFFSGIQRDNAIRKTLHVKKMADYIEILIQNRLRDYIR